jgi:hypothetical protein
MKQTPYIISSADYEIQSAIQFTSREAHMCAVAGKADLGTEINKKLEDYYAAYIGIQKKLKQ